MKTSELIKALQEQIEMWGDQDVKIDFNNQGEWGSGDPEIIYLDDEDNTIVINSVYRG